MSRSVRRASGSWSLVSKGAGTEATLALSIDPSLPLPGFLMKKTLGLPLAVSTLVLMSSCYSGPRRLSNAWNDWTNQKYSENAWMHAVLSDIIPVYPIVGFAAALGGW